MPHPDAPPSQEPRELETFRARYCEGCGHVNYFSDNVHQPDCPRETLAPPAPVSPEGLRSRVKGILSGLRSQTIAAHLDGYAEDPEPGEYADRIHALYADALAAARAEVERKDAALREIRAEFAHGQTTNPAWIDRVAERALARARAASPTEEPSRHAATE